MSLDKEVILSTLSLEEIEALAEKKRQIVRDAEEQRLLEQIAELDHNLALLEEKRQLYQAEKEKLRRKLAKLRGERVFSTLEDYRAIVRGQAAQELFDRLHGAFVKLSADEPRFNRGYIAYFHRSKFADLNPHDTYFVLYFPKRVQIHEFLQEEARETLNYHRHSDGHYERVTINLKNQDRLEVVLDALRQAIAERVDFRL